MTPTRARDSAGPGRGRGLGRRRTAPASQTAAPGPEHAPGGWWPGRPCTAAAGRRRHRCLALGKRVPVPVPVSPPPRAAGGRGPPSGPPGAATAAWPRGLCRDTPGPARPFRPRPGSDGSGERRGRRRGTGRAGPGRGGRGRREVTAERARGGGRSGAAPVPGAARGANADGGLPGERGSGSGVTKSRKVREKQAENTAAAVRAGPRSEPPAVVDLSGWAAGRRHSSLSAPAREERKRKETAAGLR